MRVLALSSQKGGSGKTTSSVHIAQYLAMTGHRVLAVDLDPQASLSALFGYQPELDLTGNDTLYGDGGNDRLDGGDGDDTVRGGDGDDIITDTGGIDTLDGGAGNDVIQGGNTNDPAGEFGNIITGGTGKYKGITGSEPFACITMPALAGSGGYFAMDIPHNTTWEIKKP